jgi:hypothetical protein
MSRDSPACTRRSPNPSLKAAPRCARSTAASKTPVAGFRKSIPRSQRAAAPVDGVAATIERALTERRPRARYVVGAGARAQAFLAHVTPTALLDVLLRAGTGVPRRL